MPEDAPSILLVDDEDGSRYARTKALEKAGFAVTAERNYENASRLLQSDKRIDLLLTDVVMPDHLHGFALARMARQRRRDVKVVYITGYDVPTTDTVGRVLRKPISEEALVDEIRHALAD
ncbi:MAG TPA: response regulator [Stellaceae bacterium]|nr:response regulator [Stellaceae bacterium]